jgi:hypothetical protein
MSIRSYLLLVLLTLAAVTGLSQDGLAQSFDGPPDASRITAMVDTLARRLSLTEAVKTQVYNLYMAFATESKKVLQHNHLSLRTRRTLQGLARQRDDEVKKLLTQEQQKEYDKIVAEQREKMRERLRG